jgi:hypothetical protein
MISAKEALALTNDCLDSDLVYLEREIRDAASKGFHQICTQSEDMYRIRRMSSALQYLGYVCETTSTGNPPYWTLAINW